MLCKSILGEKEPILKEPFIPRQLDVAALYTEGLAFHKDLGLQKTGAGGFSIVFPAEYGKTYEMHFSAETEALIAAVTDGDPRGLAIGHSMPCTEIRAVEGVHANEEEGYLSLAYFLGEVANADKKANAGLRIPRI
jgi:hypothetical protein